jgi:Domain of unknown function (DUF4129)
MKLGAAAQVSALAVLLFVPTYCIGQTSDSNAAIASQSSASSPNPLAPGALSEQLKKISEQLAGRPSKEHFGDVQHSLPSDWQIQTPQRTYSVSTQALRRLLNPDNLDDARAYIATLRQQLDTVDGAAPTTVDARPALDKILADSRFHAVRQPSAWELWRQRVNAWLLRQVQKLVLAVARHPIGAKFVFWLVLVGAVALIAFVIYRVFMRNDRIDSLHPETVRMRSRSWQEWIRAAREFAGRGDYREAIHATYWAGIKRLQDANALPLDRAKTPREYLRALVAPRAPEQESNEKYKDPLAKLTTNLELAWYANRRAGSAEFADTLQQAEALGCRLD